MNARHGDNNAAQCAKLAIEALDEITDIERAAAIRALVPAGLGA